MITEFLIYLASNCLFITTVSVISYQCGKKKGYNKGLLEAIEAVERKANEGGPQYNLFSQDIKNNPN
jgi:hypothetical protein